MQKPGRRSLLSVVNEKVLKASDQRDIISYLSSIFALTLLTWVMLT